MGSVQVGERARQFGLEVLGAGAEFVAGLVEGGDLGMVGLPKLVAFSFCVGSQLGCEPVSGGAGAVQFLSRMIPVLAQPPAPAALLPLASRSSQSSLVSRQRHVLDRLAEGRHSRGRECLGQDDATHVNPFAIRQPRFIILTPIPRVPCRKSLHGFAPQCTNRLPFAPTTPPGSCVRPFCLFWLRRLGHPRFDALLGLIGRLGGDVGGISHAHRLRAAA